MFMEFGKYPFVDLIIGLEEKVIQSPPLDDHEFTPELYEYICEAINTENMKYLYAHFGDDDSFIQVECEGNRSYIFICDETKGISYNYLNPEFNDDDSLTEIAGTEVPKNNICNKKDVLLDIIVTYLKLGKASATYTWLKTKGL